MSNLDTSNLTILGKGKCNTIYLTEVGGKKICIKEERKDKETDEQNNILVEGKLIQTLSELVPNIKIPRILEINEENRSYSYEFTYGVRLDTFDCTSLSPQQLVELFTELGLFHAQLRLIKKERVISLGIVDAESTPYDYNTAEVLHMIPRDFEPEWKELIRECCSINEQTKEDRYFQLIHDDAHSQNIFVSPDGKLLTVIDFGDALWQDIHFEFVSYIHSYPDYWKYVVESFEKETGIILNRRRLFALTVLRHVTGLLINLWNTDENKKKVAQVFEYYESL